MFVLLRPGVNIAAMQLGAALCAATGSSVEIYGLMGTYYFGNSQNVLKNREWKPQVGVGALFPVGSKWALMIDGVRFEVWGCRWIYRLGRNSTNRVGAIGLIAPYKKTRSSPRRGG